MRKRRRIVIIASENNEIKKKKRNWTKIYLIGNIEIFKTEIGRIDSPVNK